MNNLDSLFSEAQALSANIKKLKEREEEVRDQIKSILAGQKRYVKTSRTAAGQGYYMIKERENLVVDKNVLLKLAGDDIRMLKQLTNIAVYKPEGLVMLGYTSAVIKKEPTLILEIRNHD